MSVFRVLLSIIFPPLFLIVTILTCAGWIPGVIGALVILNKSTQTTTYPTYPTTTNYNNRTHCQY